jgi:chromatin segregation and condensation protein Rec8/ScpA/Scc1 (kleisin family)
LLVFAQKERLRWADLSLREVLSGVARLLPLLPLAERMELLVFVSQLLRLKAFALLPVERKDEPTEILSSSTGERVLKGIAECLPLWERQIAEQSFRLRRPASETEVEGEVVITGLTQIRLVKAYEEVILRWRRRQAVHRLEPFPFSAEEVEEQLVGLFRQASSWSLTQLWGELVPHPMYKAMAFLFLLLWIQEGKVALSVESPWCATLSWRG